MVFYTFQNDTGDNTKIIDADEVNANFDYIEGTVAPMSTGTYANDIYNIGTDTAHWLNGYITNLPSVSSARIINLTCTTANITNITTTSLHATGATITTANITNATISSLHATSATITTLNVTNLTTSSLNVSGTASIATANIAGGYVIANTVQCSILSVTNGWISGDLVVAGSISAANLVVGTHSQLNTVSISTAAIATLSVANIARCNVLNASTNVISPSLTVTAGFIGSLRVNSISVLDGITLSLTTRYFSIPAPAFLPERSTTDYFFINAATVEPQTTTAQEARAPFYLPDGAVITKLEAWGIKQTATSFAVTFWNSNSDSGVANSMATLSFTTTATGFSTTSISGATISAHYGYSVRLGVSGHTGNSLRGVKVTYTITSPLP